MADILARNPKLDDVIRKAANRLGENHGLTRDSHGAVIDNQGNSSRYVGSHGQHPSHVNKPKSNTTSGWYKTLNETEVEEDCLGEDCGGTHEMEEDIKWPSMKKIRKWKNKVKSLAGVNEDSELEEKAGKNLLCCFPKKKSCCTNAKYKEEKRKMKEMEEATGASSAGGYEGPLFGKMTESIIREEISKKVSKQLITEKVTRWTVFCCALGFRKCCRKLMGGRERIGGTRPTPASMGLSDAEVQQFKPYMNANSESDLPANLRKIYNRAIVDVPQDREELKEALKSRITRNILNEKDYLSGKLKYEKPSKLPGEIKSTPGLKQTDSTLKKSKSENTKYLKHFDKKIKDYLDFEGNSHPEFPHQNNSKTDYKSPMYRNTKEDEDFIDDFRGMGLEDANGVDMLDRIDDYLSGSKETGNAQTDKSGKALGNVVPSKTGERIKKKVKRKKKEIAKRKSKMTNLRSITPDVQTVTNLKEHYLLTERKWWQTGLRILGCCTFLFPILFRCCIDTFRSARIANPPSDFPPLDPGLSREEIKSLKPHENARSWEDLPENIQAILSKAQPKILAYIEEIKAMGGDNPRGKKVEPVTMDSPMPLGPGEIKPRTTASGTVAEDVNKMKHLFNYKDTTQ